MEETKEIGVIDGNKDEMSDGIIESQTVDGKERLKGFENDLLGRESYAKHLFELIETYAAYYSKPFRRGTDNEGYVIGISSACGSGKTEFLNMFKKYLEDNKYIVISYDAWENDYGNTAFEPFFYTICDNDTVKKIAGQHPDIIKPILSFLKRIAPTKAALKISTGGIQITTPSGNSITTPAIEGSIEKEFTEKSGRNTGESYSDIEEYNKNYRCQRQAISGLKDLLEKYYLEEVNKNKGKNCLIIFIDELDRCRPDFAIDTFEIIKHFFNIHSLVFVFAFDIMQIQSTIKTFYGNDFNAIGYLQRFFDYLSHMPEGTINVFLRQMILDHKLSLNDLGIDSSQPINEEKKRIFEETWEDRVEKICGIFMLSPREIKIIMATFDKINSITLNDYKDINVKILYFYMLALKYRHPDILLSALRGVKSSDDTNFQDRDERSSLYNFLIKNPIPFYYYTKWSKKTSKKRGRREDIEKNYIDLLLSKDKIKDYKDTLFLIFSKTGEELIEPVSFEGIDSLDYKSIDEEEKVSYVDSKSSHNRSTEGLRSISFVLYRRDIDMIVNKVESIRELRPLEYVTRKIESYDDYDLA